MQRPSCEFARPVCRCALTEAATTFPRSSHWHQNLTLAIVQPVEYLNYGQMPPESKQCKNGWTWPAPRAPFDIILSDKTFIWNPRVRPQLTASVTT